MGLPLSRVSVSAIAWASRSIRSASRHSSRERLWASVRLQAFDASAACADSTARATSSAVPSATSASTSPVAGLVVVKVPPEAEGTLSLSIQRPRADTSLIAYLPWKLARRFST